MKIGYIILCRYNSSRLPGKILKKIQGKTILQYIIDALYTVTEKENVVVATSTEDSDNPIYDYCMSNKIKVFRGSLNNVSERFKNCALKYNFDFATRINGDNIFIDLSIVNEMEKVALTDKYDFVSNVKNRTFPKGMSIEMVRTKHYNEIYKKFLTADDFEHVTIYLYNNDNNKNYYYLYNTKCIEAAGLQFAIDTKEDFYLAKQIISKLNKKNNFSLEEVYNEYRKIKNDK